MVEKKTRNPAMDLIRCIALLGVVLVHFFLNGGYYELKVAGLDMHIMTVIRTAAMVCVPLFIMLTGYLMCEKKLSAKYFFKLNKTLAVYVLASIACAAFYIMLNIFVTGQEMPIADLIWGIFAYETAPYGWYVEMYIGLYLLIPFLNILYQGLPGKREKQYLLAVLVLLTAVPYVVNIFRFSDAAWWLEPSASGEYRKILPAWWVDLYPFTYYFLGCYLREYPLKGRRRTKLGLYAAAVFCAGTFNFYRSAGARFVWGVWQEWGSLLNVIQVVLLFDLLGSLDLTALGTKSRKCLARLSDWCFGAYLVSVIFDEVFYILLEKLCPEPRQRFLYLVPVVLAVYICSLCASAVINQVYLWCCSLAGKWIRSRNTRVS